MVSQLIMPQEVEVFYIIPAVRREMAIVMKGKGLKQKEIAKKLYVRESTISQYLNNKRASDFDFNDKIKAEVSKSVENVDDKLDLIRETTRLLKIIKEDKILCEVHTSVADIPKECDVCLLK